MFRGNKQMILQVFLQMQTIIQAKIGYLTNKCHTFISYNWTSKLTLPPQKTPQKTLN